MRGLRFVLPLTLTVLLAACGATGGGDSGSGDSGDDTPGSGAGGPPLRITPMLDGTRATTQRVTPEGGVLTAEGPDGTVYTLVIPENGVVYPTEITMTPFTSVEGFPLSDGLLGAVHLEPAGLFFATPALLTIAPARSVPVERQIVFAARDDGEAFLYPVEPDRAAVQLKLWHFSAYGVGSGSDDDRSAAQGHTPSRPADRIAQDMAQASDFLRRGIITRAEWQAFFEQASRQAYEQVVKPAMDSAEALAPNGDPADAGTLSAAVGEYLAWERELQLTGLDDFMRAERTALKDQFSRVLQAYYQAIRDRCVQADLRYDPAVVQLLIGLERQMQLLGISSPGSYSDCLPPTAWEGTVRSVMKLGGPGDTGGVVWQGTVRLTLWDTRSLLYQLETPSQTTLTIQGTKGDCSYSGTVVGPLQESGGVTIRPDRTYLLSLAYGVEASVTEVCADSSYTYSAPFGGYVGSFDGTGTGMDLLAPDRHMRGSRADELWSSEWDLAPL